MKEYKVTTYSYQQGVSKMEAEIYKLADDNWTILFCQELGGNQYSVLIIFERFKTS